MSPTTCWRSLRLHDQHSTRQPNDYPKFNASIVNGATFGLGSYLSQSFAYRPVPELGQFRTPVEGLYLTGQTGDPAASIISAGRATA